MTVFQRLFAIKSKLRSLLKNKFRLKYLLEIINKLLSKDPTSVSKLFPSKRKLFFLPADFLYEVPWWKYIGIVIDYESISISANCSDFLWKWKSIFTPEKIFEISLPPKLTNKHWVFNMNIFRCKSEFLIRKKLEQLAFKN